jgi:thiol-disulfide isomerase/thioredoxin
MIQEPSMRFILAVFGLLAWLGAGAEEVDLTLPDLSGEQVSLSDFRGKWVIVNFWATWCPPCLDEIPDLVEFHEKHKDDDAVVVGISFEEVNTEYLQEFVESHFMSYPVLRMEPVPVTALGPVTGLPTTYILSPDGERIARQEGPVTGAAIEAFLERKKRLPEYSASDGAPLAAAAGR